MKKKILVALGVVFGIICCYFLLGIFGNPVSKHMVTTNAKEYIQSKWPDENYDIESVQYDFKTSNYYVYTITIAYTKLLCNGYFDFINL